ncbi:MAG: DEAD/DEAH box helicase family protein, partial [Candidatus Paceibacterota bacterium]
MKLKFDSNLEYQQDAIKSVVDLFDGQFINSSDIGFEINNEKSKDFGFSDLGVGNSLEISDEKLLENLQEIQKNNKIKPDEKLDFIKNDSYLKLESDGFLITEDGKKIILEEGNEFPNFSIEMETGTGKTYVYLRSIYELNQKYGFKKFIIVVPSIAIREGVLKNLQITQDHFKDLYGNIPLDYFVYNSSNLGKLRNFTTSNNLQVMIINIDSFRRDENIINQ